jgi:hypothetical protein
VYRQSRTACVLLVVLSLFGGDGRAALPASSPVTLEVPGRSNATPWVAAAGSFVAVAWGATAAGKTDVFVAVSRDGGVTFRAPRQVNTIDGEARLGGELPPRVSLARKTSTSVPEIVVVWTARGAVTEIKSARSRDGGRTFGAPVTLQSSGAAGDRGWPAIALDRRANLHAVWLDHRGMTVKTPAPAAGAPHQHDGAAMAKKSGLYYASAGTTVAHDRQVTDGVCYCCKTALTAGADGTLYAAWRHVYPGNFRDMAFTMSRDGGRTFSPPARVSEDGWSINGCPDDGPALAADTRGTVHVVWPAVVGGDTPHGAIFYASTRDGRRFTPRVWIPTLGGPKPSHPQIVADARGRIVIAWDETVDGRRVAAARELRLDRNREVSFGEPIVLAPNGAATYPVLASTASGLVAVWSTGGDRSRVEARVLPF